MIRVLVVDDHSVVRYGLSTILRLEPEFELVGEAGDGREAVRLIMERRPDVVLLDLRLPELSGVEVMRQVRPLAPDVRFLVLTTYDTDSYIAPALAAGANGYLLKDVTPDELASAVRSLVKGGAALQPGVAARVLTRLAGNEHGEELSARELEVLRLLADGDSNRAIAARLNLSENTVKTYTGRIFSKLDVQSRAEAVALALQRGLISLDRA